MMPGKKEGEMKSYVDEQLYIDGRFSRGSVMVFLSVVTSSS